MVRLTFVVVNMTFALVVLRVLYLELPCQSLSSVVYVMCFRLIQASSKFTTFISYLMIIVIRHTPPTCTKPACDHDPELCPDNVICEPIPAKLFNKIEIACVTIFTADYLIRVFTVGFMQAR